VTVDAEVRRPNAQVADALNDVIEGDLPEVAGPGDDTDHCATARAAAPIHVHALVRQAVAVVGAHVDHLQRPFTRTQCDNK